jgi:hypothetical protein
MVKRPSLECSIRKIARLRQLADLPNPYAEEYHHRRFVDGNIDTLQQIAGGHKFLYLCARRIIPGRALASFT